MLDLFSGIGGFALAAQWVWGKDLNIVGFSEVDDYAIKVYRQWFDVKFLGPIQEVGKVDCDLITAGFPCQDVSVANPKRKGLEGERTGLFWKLAEIIELSTPKWILLENVPGLLSQNGGKDMYKVVRELSEIGYCVCWRVLNSRYFGVAQSRRRVWIVGSFGSTDSAKVLFEQKSGCRHDTKVGEVQERGFCISTRDGQRQDPTAETYIASTIQANDYGKVRHGQYGNEGNLVAYTLNTGQRGCPGRIWEETCIATVDALGKRTSDGISGRAYNFDNKRGHCLGNAIVPQVAQVIFQAIKEIENDTLPSLP